MKKKADVNHTAIELAVRLTQWNLGVLVAISLAFGGCAIALNYRFTQLDKNVSKLETTVNHTRYLIAVALGLVAPGEYREDGTRYQATPPVSTIAATAVAEEASVGGGEGTSTESGGGSITLSEGERNVRSF